MAVVALPGTSSQDLPPKPPIKFPNPPAAPCCNCFIIFCSPGIPPKIIHGEMFKKTWLQIFKYEIN